MLLAVLLLLAAGGWLLVALTGDRCTPGSSPGSRLVAVVATTGLQGRLGPGTDGCRRRSTPRAGPAAALGLWGLYS